VAAAQVLFISLRRCRPVVTHNDLNGRAAAILQRLAVRRKIRLLQSPGLTGPIAFGILRPSVGLPEDFAAKFSPAEQDAMLAHELAHLASRDPLWYLLADVGSAALWWHPQVWWARRRLHRASELAADEAAAIFPEGPTALAECLVTLGKRMTQLPGTSRMGVEGGGFRSHLAERVQRLLRLADMPQQPSYGWRARASRLGAILAISAAAIALSGCLQSRDAVKQPTLQANLSQSWNTSPVSTVWHSALPPKKPEPQPAPTPDNLPILTNVVRQQVSVWHTNAPPDNAYTGEKLITNNSPGATIPPAPALETRIFRVEPNNFVQRLQEAFPQAEAGQPNTNTGGSVPPFVIHTGTYGDNAWLLRCFGRMGINLTNNGDFFFFNNRTGDILARATAQDLSTLEQVLQVLNKVPPQVQIDAIFVSVTQDGANAAPITNVPAITGILTASQFRTALNAIEQRNGAEILSMPRITTESGRQAHVAMSADIVPGANLGTNTTTAFEEGPALDVLPTLSGNGYTIHLVLSATTKEFHGYGKPSQIAPPSNVVSNLQTGMPASDPLPLSVFRSFSATTALDVWDGQTVLLGGPMQESDSSQPQSTNRQRANLMVFITVRLIDPAGNLVHTEEEMPFVKESIPPKTPGNGVPK
jgi:hypothetical protein